MTVSVLIFMYLLILSLKMVLLETDPKIQRTNYVRLPGKVGRGAGDGQSG